MIHHEFIACLNVYTSNHELQQLLWMEVENHYQESHRHYHTLHHLNSILADLLPFKNSIRHWDALIMAIAYHDLVYDVNASDNEEQSAAIARDRLTSVSFPESEVDFCCRVILATKSHAAEDKEIQLFIDADLSILGSSLENYLRYSRQIRFEYAHFPDDQYYAGRRKILKDFLNRKSIFLTDEFSSRYEEKARFNLEHELALRP
jgi:predicted metal-dependent HD superfamily phosphohydrolase